MIIPIIQTPLHHLGRDPRALHLEKRKVVQISLGVHGDGVAVGQQRVGAELEALQEAGVAAEGGDERHAVHGEPARVADRVGARAVFAPVAFFPVVLRDDGAAAFEDAGAVAWGWVVRGWHFFYHSDTGTGRGTDWIES